jgi:peptidoglycan/LPS O-acetylase OafA/YrhL
MPVTGNTQRTAPEKPSFYPALDGLRAMAFVTVFLDHYYELPWGWTGVNVFFVLSGFLITGILFDSRDDRHRARNFYVRRTLRIFPLYYGVIFGVLLLIPLMHWKLTWAWVAWPLYLGNFLRLWAPSAAVDGSALQSAANGWLHSVRFPQFPFYVGHFWSLCVEEQFYLVWPWVVFWIRSRRALLWVCASIVVLEAVARVLVKRTAPPWMIHQDLLHSFTPFALGSMLLGGWVALFWRGRHRERLVLIARIVAIVATLMVIVYFARTLHPTRPNWCHNYVYPPWVSTIGIPFANVLAASVMVCMLVPDGYLYRLFSLRPLRWLGRISYGAYVFHDIFHGLYAYVSGRFLHALTYHVSIRFMFLFRRQDEIYPLLAFTCTLALAWLSFRFYESRFLNLKERWTLRGGA